MSKQMKSLPNFFTIVNLETAQILSCSDPRCLLLHSSLRHYLGKTMTLWNLIWDNPCRAHSYSTYYSPLFQSSATGPVCPVGGVEVGVDLAKLKSLYPRGGVKVMLRSSIWQRNDRHLVRAYKKDRCDDANGLGGEERHKRESLLGIRSI